MSRIACALVAALFMGCSAAPPNVVLIVIDTLRADHLGAYGYARPTSPNLDRLASEGHLFTDAVATSSWTKPSVASLFTSLLPSEHGAVSFDRGLREDVPTLPEHLARAGYSTYAVSGNFVHINKGNGFARGFAGFQVLTYRTDDRRDDPILRDQTPGRDVAALRAPRASEVNFAALEHLRRAPEGPVFLYVHYMEPHAGYVPEDAAGEPEFTSRALWEIATRAERLSDERRDRMIEAYDAEISAVDAGVGRLVEKLEKLGFLDNAVLFVVSDHGEEFFEHGNWQHGLSLHVESIAIPLIVRDFRSGARAGRSDEPVDLLDVAPTILRLAGVTPTAGARGRDLLSGLGPRDRFAELHPDPIFEDQARARLHRLALLRDPWRALVRRDGGVDVYRSDTDPGERAALAPSEEGDALSDRALGLAKSLDALVAGGSRRVLDADDLEGLRALGYVE